MKAEKFHPAQLTYKPLRQAEWPDFVALFEQHGIQNGCWCMVWRIPMPAIRKVLIDEHRL